MTRLPLLDRDMMLQLITADVSPAALEKPAGTGDVARTIERLFGPEPALSPEDLRLPPAARLRQVYAALIDSDRFRAACGRISASYAW
jgi:hypothetical protein